jgi:hypothetical protein
MDINLLKQHLSQVHGRLSINNSKGGYGNHNICEQHEELQHEELQHEEVSLTDLFIENYFGDSLSEDTTEDEILEAVTELNYTCYQVNEFFNGDRDESEEIDEDAVTDYFESYFGINLNEHAVEDDDIVEAINHLNILCGEVNETFEIDEGIFSGIGKGLVGGALGYGAYKLGKWAKKKWGEHKAKQKGLERDAGKHRKNVATHQRKTDQGYKLRYGKPKSNAGGAAGDAAGGSARSETSNETPQKPKQTLPKLQWGSGPNPNKNLPTMSSKFSIIPTSLQHIEK